MPIQHFPKNMTAPAEENTLQQDFAQKIADDLVLHGDFFLRRLHRFSTPGTQEAWTRRITSYNTQTVSQISDTFSLAIIRALLTREAHDIFLASIGLVLPDSPAKMTRLGLFVFDILLDSLALYYEDIADYIKTRYNIHHALEPIVFWYSLAHKIGVTPSLSVPMLQYRLTRNARPVLAQFYQSLTEKPLPFYYRDHTGQIAPLVIKTNVNMLLPAGEANRYIGGFSLREMLAFLQSPSLTYIPHKRLFEPRVVNTSILFAMLSYVYRDILTPKRWINAQGAQENEQYGNTTTSILPWNKQRIIALLSIREKYNQNLPYRQKTYTYNFNQYDTRSSEGSSYAIRTSADFRQKERQLIDTLNQIHNTAKEKTTHKTV